MSASSKEPEFISFTSLQSYWAKKIDGGIKIKKEDIKDDGFGKGIRYTCTSGKGRKQIITTLTDRTKDEQKLRLKKLSDHIKKNHSQVGGTNQGVTTGN